MNLKRRQTLARASSAFTMIEIAISLAVIGFAMVAIIGILPTGMNVQKENREDTIINHDASVFLDLIRNGARGSDDLTNYVVAITNYVSVCLPTGRPINSFTRGYTYTSSSTVPPLPITNGSRIIGLLSTPRFLPNTNLSPAGSFYSNYVVAFVRSISGAASEKHPQTNQTVQDLTLSYRMIPEILPYGSIRANLGTPPGMFEPDWTNYLAYTNSTQFAPYDWQWRSNYFKIARTYETNMCDMRLIFRWPLLTGGTAGNRRQVFRTTLSGHMLHTNDYYLPQIPLYFFEPRTYVRAQL